VVGRARRSPAPRAPPCRASRPSGRLYLRELGEDWPQGWGITEALLARVDAVARGAGAPLLVVLSPTQWQTYDDMWRDRDFMGTGSQNERRFSPTAPE
jgi:hypothetical protein